ncbi:MAG: cell division protein FtsA [Erysipelotrichaceae bacterium]|nr:cell division protein FtsA [Erysipelotrichaceae bacterium]
MKQIYAVLDIGSATIKLLVGETVSANINILFTKKMASHGIRKGIIEDVDAVAADIRKIVDEASAELGAPINAVALTLPSRGAHIYQGDGITKVNSDNDRIGVDDIIRTLKLSRRFALDKTEEIVSVVPVMYYLDTRRMDTIPLGMKTASLKVESMMITLKKKLFYSYLMAIEKAGLDLLDVTINAYSSALEAFDAACLQDGAILIDVGFDATSVALFEGGYLKYLAQVPVGGYDLTKAVALAWMIDMATAEKYKVKYGTCEDAVGEEDVIHTTKYGNDIKNYTQYDLSSLMQKAVNELMEVIKTKIDVIHDGRDYEIVIVGGGAELPGFERIASARLGTKVTCYRPQTIGGRDMALTSCLGMMYYLDDRKELNGEDRVSMILPELSNTIGVRLKGLTKNKEEKKKKEDDSDGRIKKIVNSFFTEE